MKRVTGIGGIFSKAKDAPALRAWCRLHLGVPFEDWCGSVFKWAGPGNPGGFGSTAWSVFEDGSSRFGSGQHRFMINFRVADLHALLAALRAEGCNVDAKVEESPYGKFGWVSDPEGHRVELWEPPAGQ